MIVMGDFMISGLRESYKNGEVSCLVDLTMRVIGGKWKARIIWYLGKNQVLRYGELKRKLGKITHKMLTQQLRELEALDMVHRKEYYQIPPKVEYSLTQRGKTVMPLLEDMCNWSRDNVLC